MKSLAIWMNGEHVGSWTVGRTGSHRLEYSASWLRSPRCRPLSLSLPFTADRQLEGIAVKHYFDNLLPDSEIIRKRISTRFKTQSIDAFALLQAIGRDCVGAVQLLPAEQLPIGFDQINCQPLTPAEIAANLNGLGSPLGADASDKANEFRLSIAGAQEKTALLRFNGEWCRPLGATPTTHILKPQIGITAGRLLDLRHSVENEWFCNQVCQTLGLPAAQSEIVDFANSRALAVTRFDRQRTREGWIARLPQEDFCQAKGVPSTFKYERDGGPGMRECLGILKGSQNFHEDGRTFLCAQLLFWFLAAIDGHAKNFSLFVLPEGHYRLTPLYDVLSAWPIIGKGAHQLAYKKTSLAMAVRATNPHYKLAEIQHRHWQQLAQTSGVEGAWESMLDMVDRLDDALTSVMQRLPADFPPSIARAIADGVRLHLKKFARE